MAYYLTAGCAGLGVGILGPTLPSLANQTDTDLGSMGVLILIGAIGSILGTISGGTLYGKLNGHRVLGLAQIFAAVLLAMMPIIPSFWLLLVIMLIRMIAMRLVSVGNNMLLLWVYGKKVGPLMNGLHFCLGLGAFLAPLILAQAFSIQISYQFVYWLLALISLLVGFYALTTPNNPPAPEIQTEATGEATPLITGLIVISALFFLTYVGTEFAFTGWLFSYVTELGLATAVEAAYLTSGFWFAFTVGRLISIPVAMRFLPSKIILAALAGCFSFILLMLVNPGSMMILWVAVFGFGICMAPLWPNGFTLAGQINQLDARRTSFVMLGDSLGLMLFPWLVGKVMFATHPNALNYLIILGLMGTLVCAIFMNQKVIVQLKN